MQSIHVRAHLGITCIIMYTEHMHTYNVHVAIMCYNEHVYQPSKNPAQYMHVHVLTSSLYIRIRVRLAEQVITLSLNK